MKTTQTELRVCDSCKQKTPIVDLIPIGDLIYCLGCHTEAKEEHAAADKTLICDRPECEGEGCLSDCDEYLCIGCFEAKELEMDQDFAHRVAIGRF